MKIMKAPYKLVYKGITYNAGDTIPAEVAKALGLKVKKAKKVANKMQTKIKNK